MLKRYAYREMQTLWSEENRYKTWLKVELAVLEARFKLRELPREGFEAIRYHARINVARINELDNLYRHDMIAFIESVQESLETAGAAAICAAGCGGPCVLRRPWCPPQDHNRRCRAGHLPCGLMVRGSLPPSRSVGR